MDILELIGRTAPLFEVDVACRRKELEDLVYYLIYLSENDLTKFDSSFSISTRMGMEVIKLDPPPMGNIPDYDSKH